MLMENSRRPILEIAKNIGISGAAIHQRLRKLESQNLIIVGSATIVIGDMDMLSFGFKNKDVDQEQVDLVVELFGIGEDERVIH